jgi:homeobox protein cut-like
LGDLTCAEPVLKYRLEGMRTKLDEVGLKIAEHQEESMQNRRKLAEATWEFKRSSSDAVSKSTGTVLKGYQEEIDRLTKRAKHGETAFLELYQKLYEAPNPAPALALAFETASRATDLEAQCRWGGCQVSWVGGRTKN